MWACGLGGTMRDCLRANAGLLACFCVHCRCGSLKPHLVSQRGVKNCISYTASRYKKHDTAIPLVRSPLTILMIEWLRPSWRFPVFFWLPPPEALALSRGSDL